MIIYNLTDVAPFSDEGRTPTKLKVMGRVIAPGKSVEMLDGTKMMCPGFVQRGMISVDSLPPWYQAAKEERRHAENVKVESALDARLSRAPKVGKKRRAKKSKDDQEE